ncbi:putative epoxide hydrolase [Nemania sp. FL0031]|nr:putative epoxide hydrolase [Nemania sp. FL0031]
MAQINENDILYADGTKTIHYLAAGPPSGPLIIFLHGWPAIGLTWKQQLQTFAGLGFRAVAPDMPGWGKSTSRRVATDYTQEALVEGMIALLAANERSAAIWVGHDWGAAVASSLAAHHPHLVQALVLLCIPYRSIELGLDHIVSLVDRTVYPEDEYPFGSWDYMAYYEESFEKAVAEWDGNITGLSKLLFAPPAEGRSAADASKPAFTATMRKTGGLFGGNPAPAAETLPDPVLEADVFDAYIEATEKTGFWPGTAYYINHKANAAYNNQVPNGGRLGKDKPVLFIHARFDFVCPSLTRLSDPMREACDNLTEVTIEAGHYLTFERPEDVDAVIARFLVEQGKQCWPGYADLGYHKTKA